MVTVVETAIALLGVYAVLGVLAAIVLQVKGLHALDPQTRGAAKGFRVLVTPGLIALWPILLWKWRKVASGGEITPDPHRPVAPRALRRTQSGTWRLVTLLAVVLATLGLLNRPPLAISSGEDPRSLSAVADPTPLANVSRELGVLFPELPIEVRIRGEAGGSRRQLELEVAEDLAVPTLALYWCPPGSRTDDAPGAGAVFIGTVWGPGTRRFALSEAVSGDGEWVLYSIARATMLAIATMSEVGGDR